MAKSGSKADAKRKHVEELRESEDRFRILADDAPVLIWVTGPDGSEFVNLAYLEFVGVSREVDVLHFDWTQYVHPDDQDRYLNEYLDCFRRQVPFNAVLRFRRHDGVYRWMKSIGKPRYTPSGEFYGYVGSTQDITDVMLLEDELLKARNNLEAAVEQRTRELRESEDKYRRIVETASEGIWLLDKDNVTSFVNPAIPRMLGYAQQEIIGKKPFDFIDDAYREKVRDHLRSRQEGAEDQYVCKYRRKDGGEVWAIITANPIYDDGEYAGAFAMITDITERTRAESALKQREFDLSLSQKIAHIGSWRWDETTGRDEWSDEFYRILGYEPGEVKPDSKLYMSMVHPDDRELVKSDAVKALAEKRPISLDYRIVRRDGVIRHVHMEIARMLTDRRGTPVWEFGTIQDITERKWAEEALRESEERYRALAETSPDGIIVEKDGKYLYANPAALRLHGADSFDQLQEYNVLELIHPEDRERVTGRMRNMEKGCILPLNEGILLRLDGQPVYFESAGTQINYGGGTANQVIIRDITKRKLAEEALRDSQAHLSSIFRAAPAGIGVVVDRVITEANDRLCEMTGYTRDELLGKSARIFYPTDEDYEYVGREKYEEIRQHGTGSVETRWRRKDGRVIDILLSSTPLEPDNLGAGVTFTALDITRRKRMEKALHDTLSKAERHAGELDALVASIADAMMVVDKDGNIVYMNTEALRIFGYVPGDYRKPIAERTVQLRARYPDGTPLKTEDMLAYRALHGETVNNIEMVFNRADVSPLCIIASAAPIKDTHGSISGAVITLIDNTKRKQAEEALKVAKAQAELYLDIMGHDINNMHQIAIGYLELVEGIIPDDDPRKELLEKPTEVLQRSAQLIRNVRKLQKLQEGAFQTQDVEVCQLLVDVQREFGSVPNKAVTLNMNGCDHCHVRANELLHDVFANLVSNAIKHTGDKADIVVSLDVAESNGNRFCRVSVADNGPGIPDDFKGNIFNRMLKGTNKAKGMGLGLYLVKSLVESYGGRVWVEDRVSGDHTKGAKFVVMLPTVDNH